MAKVARVQHREIGAPAEVLELVEEEANALGEGEARVRVLAAPIHPSNLLQIAGLYGVQPDLPDTPGSEGVGEVVELGAGVTDLSVGQRVLLAGVGGTWCSELIAPAARLIPAPDEGDVEQLSMVTVNPLTAWLMLTSIVELSEGDWIVQSAANSAVGECVIQLARALKLKTVNVVRRASLIPELEALGADVVLEDGPDLAERIRARARAPVRLAIDAVAGDTFAALFESLGKGGTAVSYGAMSMQPAGFHPGRVIFRDLRVRGFWLTAWFQRASREARAQAYREIIPRITRGEVAMKVEARFPLTEIEAAVRRAGEGGRSGKVLLVPTRP